MRDSPPSLRRRLLALVVGLAGAAWIAIAVATFLDARYHTGRMLDAQLVEYSEVLGAIASHEALEIAGAATRHDPAFVQSCTYQVYSLEGALLLRSHDAPNSPLVPADGFSDASTGGVKWRAYRRADAENGTVVIVAHDVAQRDAFVGDLASRLVVPITVGLPVLSLALWLAVSRTLRPLERLAQEVRGREADHLAPLETAGLPAEVAPLVMATNQLFARVERSFENERRFTGDAAHELRTPLAALRTQAEVALTTPNEDRRRRALERVVEGVWRATRVVEQMLVLARLDAHELQAPAPVDLVATCRDAIAECEAQAGGRRVVVELDAQDDLAVQGDGVTLQALARNLLDNAVRFAPDGGRVQVTLRRDDRWACLSVEDSGPGIARDQRERIFDRFFRGDEGRGPGSGLGLSIVRRIVELHGGSVVATSGPTLGGLRVEARIPCAR